MTHLDQSRARPKTFDGLYSKISIFLLLAKSVATETFFPPALTHFHHNHLQLHRHHHHHHIIIIIIIEIFTILIIVIIAIIIIVVIIILILIILTILLFSEPYPYFFQLGFRKRSVDPPSTCPFTYLTQDKKRTQY